MSSTKQLSTLKLVFKQNMQSYLKPRVHGTVSFPLSARNLNTACPNQSASSTVELLPRDDAYKRTFGCMCYLRTAAIHREYGKPNEVGVDPSEQPYCCLLKPLWCVNTAPNVSVKSSEIICQVCG